MNISDKQAIYKLHQKYSHGIYKDKLVEIGWNHSLIVAEIALQIAQNLERDYGIKTDKQLIESGAWVHDIGFYSCFDDHYQISDGYVKHGYLGYLILKKEKISECVARMALIHVGVGINKEQIEKEKITMPIADYLPISLEEEIVTYADGFHSKGRPRFCTYSEIYEDTARRDNEYAIALDRFRRKFGEPDLAKLIKKYEKWHQEIDKWVKTIKEKNN